MKKKVLYIGNKLSKHGFTPTSIETLGPLLEAEGYQMLYASDKKNPAMRILDMLGSIRRHRKQLGAVLIDTYSSSAFFYAWASGRLCKALGVNYITILRGGNLPHRMENSPALTRQLFASAYTNIVISGYLQKSMQEHGYKNRLINNNINLAIYPYLHRASAKPKLLWVRAFHSTYNPQLAIHLIKKLSAQFPDVKLTMVGPAKDDTMEVCKKLSEELGVAGRIAFTGRLSKPDWIKLSAESDVFINTTNFDNLPISVIEALALGMPVVTTNVGGIPYLVQDGVDGLMVEPDNLEQMTAAVTSILEQPALAAQLSTNARSKSEQYDWRVIKNEWADLLMPLVS